MTALPLTRGVLLTVGAVLLATCGGDGGVAPPPPPPPGPTPGWLTLRLTTPNGDDGGIHFTVGGAPLDSVRSSHPRVIFRRESATQLRVIIVGTLAAGPIGEIRVPDTRQAAGYTATVHEAAARGSFAQRAATGYGITISP